MSTFFTKIVQEAAALGWLDWTVTVTALVYVVLAARQNAWCWAWGIISCSLWAYASFFLYNLWLDALLQIFYVIMGFVGIYRWMGRRGDRVMSEQMNNGRSDGVTKSNKNLRNLRNLREKSDQENETTELPITRLTLRQHLYIIIGGSLTALLFGYFFDIYTPAAATYLDAFVTIFSVSTTFILVQKKLDNWAYWVVIDAASVYLFGSRGAYLFAFIMIIYTIIAANAFLQWRKEWRSLA